MKPALVALVALSLFVVLMLPRPTEAAPSGMTLAQACRGDGMVDVGFRWKTVTASTVSMFLDVSFVDNGWKKGSFSSVGPMDQTITGTSAGGFIPNKDYFIRVNQQLSNGAWEASSTYQFAAIDCTDPHNRTLNAGGSSSSSSSSKATKPAPDPLSIPKSAGSSSSSDSSSNDSSPSTNETDSTPAAPPADSSSTQCSDGATVYGGGSLACANHGGVAR